MAGYIEGLYEITTVSHAVKCNKPSLVVDQHIWHSESFVTGALHSPRLSQEKVKKENT